MIVVVMGVSGAGKTTIGQALAATLEAEFAEGDIYHPAANIEKMRRGEALDDTDRAPWLAALAGEIGRWQAEGRAVVLACSALRESYRRTLGIDHDRVRLVYLRGAEELIRARIARRQHGYMPASLLASQFAALEEPREAITVDITASPVVIVQRIVARLRSGA
ncbi:MAG: gluconokinase [Alphaproteobacteria bacterium]|nr:gluconokinase [Alphaproteobacteria bacterium]